MLGLGAHGDGSPILRHRRRNNVARVKLGMGRRVGGAVIGDWIRIIGVRWVWRDGIGWIRLRLRLRLRLSHLGMVDGSWKRSPAPVFLFVS